ncbi:MAG: site-specific DNA-methyltransferase [Paenibacillus macerans]|uniref:site-specific DNA-methyltransferase n=1 Tax=Paenibacillus macerans TaxID=44252 RepID=UPI00243178B8|nr:site-specific DNA-methyltransferase [Paenibacillus macerans]MBS5911988.1 site-specific DNA-methyltransferase [Paenibacillus macerans]
MNKLTMKSVDLTQANIDKIAELFPNVITEARDEQGKIKRAVDFDLLKQELSDVLVEGEKERYQLTWPGKKQAIFTANSPIDKTLRPIKGDSVDWENTKNLYIEGDNLEVLKLLQESYLNKVKIIYIDPPYNTGNDFIYKDDFKKNTDEYLEESGQINEEGMRLVPNPSSNGRFHSDWLTMIYSRLKIARNLLKDDGAIFISIDDNEFDNVKKVCDEIFGTSNFITAIPWQSRQSIQNDTDLSTSHEYIIVYAKVRRQENRRLKESNINSWFKEKTFAFYPLPLDESKFENPDNDPRGKWKADPFDAPNVRPNLTYKIVNPNTGQEFWPPSGRCWRTEEENYKKLLADNRIIFGKNGESRPQLKVFYNEKRQFGSVENTWFDGNRCGTTTEGTKEQQKLFDGLSFFDTPKPTRLIKKILELTTAPQKDDIVLDFFSGSATTAHAVMQLNAEDQGNRKFIMVQLPEETNETSEAYKAGYKNICEIGKERIRRAAKKIKEETGADIDYGFRVFRVDSSNMKEVYYTPDKLGQMNLDDLSSNIKEDRTGEDLLIQVMLECGLELSLPMESKEIEGKTIYYVAENSLIACFDEDVPESVIKKIAADQPLRVVFRDSSFRDDSARINVEELFKLLSPSTEIQVL